jgi:hypothetical protein
VLLLPDYSKPFTVSVDASDHAIGGVLQQEGPSGKLQPVAYESKKLSPAEVKYGIYEREFLALDHCLKAWRCYLHGPRFTAKTDHLSLKYINDQANIAGRPARWAEFF